MKDKFCAFQVEEVNKKKYQFPCNHMYDYTKDLLREIHPGPEASQ